MRARILAAMEWLGALFRRAHSKGEPSQTASLARLNTGRWSRELLQHLEWQRLEELCAAYFNELGYRTEVTHEHADGRAELCLYSGDAQQASILAHCKPWDPYPLGVKTLREVRAAMTASIVNEGAMVTTGRFTPEAVAYAKKEKIDLVDGAALLAKLAALPPEKSAALLKLATKGDFLTPTCPRCFIKMTGRKSTRQGRLFWGCRNYPQCKITFSSTAISPA
ncbi:MAG TPA: restriction endonuclease, partial [Burkholderiales bacterium]|nr:restriction endonuclease [Burkholderiales bacterium]